MDVKTFLFTPIAQDKLIRHHSEQQFVVLAVLAAEDKTRKPHGPQTSLSALGGVPRLPAGSHNAAHMVFAIKAMAPLCVMQLTPRVQLMSQRLPSLRTNKRVVVNATKDTGRGEPAVKSDLVNGSPGLRNPRSIDLALFREEPLMNLWG